MSSNVARDITIPRTVRMVRCAEMAARWTGEYVTSMLVFRAEKRSVQASAHPLSQAYGGLFCLLSVFVCRSVTVLTETE